ncbi:MAG: hypothetical protein R3F62_01425 [Planctomycetota bacterium]
MNSGERLCAKCDCVYDAEHVPADGRCVEDRCRGELVQRVSWVDWASLACAALGSALGLSGAWVYFDERPPVDWTRCAAAAAVVLAVGLLLGFSRHTRYSPYSRGGNVLALGLIYPPLVLLTFVVLAFGLFVVVAGVAGTRRREV